MSIYMEQKHSKLDLRAKCCSLSEQFFGCKRRKSISSKGGIIMTANQIAYNKYVEESRHNIQTEGVERRKALAAWNQAGAAQSQALTASARAEEEKRHNREAERVSSASQVSTEKYQRDTGAAALKQAESSETQAKSSVVQGEAAARRAAVEEARLPIYQYEAESSRIGALAKQTSASAAVQQAQVAAMRASEDARAHRVQEGISRASLAESIRHNGLTEAISAQEARTHSDALGIRREELEELAGYHQGQLDLRAAELEETQSHNRATESAQGLQTAGGLVRDFGMGFKSIQMIGGPTNG